MKKLNFSNLAVALGFLSLGACTGGGLNSQSVQYSGSASVDANLSLDVVSVKVDSGSGAKFTVTPATGYAFNQSVGGTCPSGSWNGNVYTTGGLTQDCTVSFTSSVATYSVTPSVDAHLTASPSAAQTVNYNGTQAFTLTTATGYNLNNSVGGTCPAGSWSGSTYTTGVITANCTVSFTSTAQTYTMTPSVDSHVTSNPSSVQTVSYGSTQSFTLSANTGYNVSSTVGGTCAAGSWSGSTYTTGVVTGSCSVSFSGTIRTFTVTPSADANTTISPNTAQTVNYNTTKSFTVTGNSGYTANSTVGGTCAAGSWSGSTYTTGNVTANCTVSFSSTANPPTVGTAITFSGVSTSGLTVNWGTATDSADASNQLQYKVVKATSSSNISTAAQVNAITTTGAGLVQDWTTNVTTTALTGLSAGDYHYYAVAVKNTRGGVAVYTPTGRVAGKIAYMSTSSEVANFGAISNADSFCSTHRHAVADTTATVKAMIADGTTRIACTSANCAVSGASENVNWPLNANYTYYVPAGGVWGTTNSAGIFTSNFSNAFTSYQYTFLILGLNSDWTSTISAATCQSYTSSSSSDGIQLGDASRTVLSDFLLISNTSCDYASNGTVGAYLICIEQ